MRSLTFWVLGLAALGALASTADAATLTVGRGKKHETIAAAVAAAETGDRIQIFPGRYFESVTADVAGLQFVARGRVFWYGDDYSGTPLTIGAGGGGSTVQGIRFRGSGTGLVVEGSDVVVNRCDFRGMGKGIDVDGNGVEITRCNIYLCGTAFESDTADDLVFDRNRIRHTNSSCVQIEGDDAVVTRNDLRGSGDDAGFEIQGDDVLVERNRIRSVWNEGIDVDGDGAHVLRNRVEYITSAHGIQVVGADAVVERNFVGGAYDDGIHVEGGSAVVERNTILGTGDDGIDVRGSLFQVRNNVVSDCSDPSACIAVDTQSPGKASSRPFRTNGDAPLVVGNVVRDTPADGFDVRGQGVYVGSNRAYDCGGSGFTFYGADHEAVGNTAIGARWAGFRIFATGTTLEKCVARSIGRDGFRIEATGVSLDGCRADDCDAEGLHDSGFAGRFENCTFRNNGQDVGANGTGGNALVDDGGNRFTTGGVDVPTLD